MKVLCTVIGLMFSLIIINCTSVNHKHSYDSYTNQTYRVRVYDKKGRYQGYEEHTKYRTRYYDSKGRYRGYSK